MDKKLLGKIAEDLAVQFLEKSGYQIIDRNWHLENFGEIDIIAKNRKIFNFVEVKSLFAQEEFLPEQHFTKNKFSKIKKIAEFYVNQKNIDDWFISLIAINFFPEIKINYYENVQV